MHVYCLRKHEVYRKEQLFIRVVVPMIMTTPTFLLPHPRRLMIRSPNETGLA
jgi:hypothetical protein